MILRTPFSKINQIQGRLLSLAALFMLVFSILLTLAPAGRERSWQAGLHWDHWVAFFLWLIVFNLLHAQSARWLPQRDPFLLPLTGLLTAWGLLTIWRLLPFFGARQAIWLVLSAACLWVGLRLPSNLRFLRRYKYLWLTGALGLTALTLVFGTNPLGAGPRMWLGCCGIYLQPSEPLKLLLIAYLAGYLADNQAYLLLTSRRAEQGAARPSRITLLPLLMPTLLMTGIALALLVVQRDLGAAFIFFLLYAAVVYVASGNWQILAVTLAGALLAGVVGYVLFDVVQLRVEAWINPWLDPSGRSYQIIQSLLAVANGGLVGRGPGLGNPGVVPVSHSDLIFSAISEEHGLAGVVGLLISLAFLAQRGLRISLAALDPYRRYLAAGLTAYLVGQSLLIIGGNLRLVPLTGVTLPFVSYGGSSLLVSFVSVLLLLHISAGQGEKAQYQTQARPYRHVGSALAIGLLLCALLAGWWAVVRAPGLLERTDNPRRTIVDRIVLRGAILDRQGEAINQSQGEAGQYQRQTTYPPLSNLVGYTDPTYGQSGLEASLDGVLRGLQGNLPLDLWWNHLAYGQPPPGIDVRLSLDLDLQRQADELLEGRRGALVLLNAQNGEILAMAAHPTFNANRLAEDWQELVVDPDAPLLNRAVLGRYAAGSLEQSFLDRPLVELGLAQLKLPGLLEEPLPEEITDQPEYSPLQVALAAAIVSNGGSLPQPVLVSAMNLPGNGWMPYVAPGGSTQAFDVQAAEQLLERYRLDEAGLWGRTFQSQDSTGQGLTWFLGGATSAWGGPPLALAVLLEETDPAYAQDAGLSMLEAVMSQAQ